MTTLLAREPVASVLAGLRAYALVEDARARERIPDLEPYLDHVRSAGGAYSSLTLLPAPGLEVSVRNA